MIPPRLHLFTVCFVIVLAGEVWRLENPVAFLREKAFLLFGKALLYKGIESTMCYFKQYSVTIYSPKKITDLLLVLQCPVCILFLASAPNRPVARKRQGI